MLFPKNVRRTKTKIARVNKILLTADKIREYMQKRSRAERGELVEHNKMLWKQREAQLRKDPVYLALIERMETILRADSGFKEYVARYAGAALPIAFKAGSAYAKSEYIGEERAANEFEKLEHFRLAFEGDERAPFKFDKKKYEDAARILGVRISFDANGHEKFF